MFSHKLPALTCLGCSVALLLAACSPREESLLLSFSTNTPTGLAATADDRDITISWNAVETADSYTLFRYTNSNCASIPEDFANCDNAFRWQGLTSNAVEDTSLINDQIYYYKVIAQSSDGDSSLSEQASARTAPAVAPPAPANITWDFLGAEAIQFIWEANQYADYYVVYRVTDAEASGCAIPSSTANCGDDAEATQSEHISADFSWTDTSFTPGLNYDYVIVAFNNYGTTTSNRIAIQTIAAAPTLSSINLNNSGLSLEWTNQVGADYYELFRYTEFGCLSDDNADIFASLCADALRVSNLTSTEYLDALTGVDATSVYYRLRSINDSGTSLLSAELEQDLDLLAPDEFNLSSSSAGDANYLHWSPVLFAESYTIYRYQDATCEAQPELCAGLITVDLSSEIFSYKDANIDLGDIYYYNIRAINDTIGLGDLSSTVDSTSAPTAATNLQATVGNSQVDLTWDEHNNSSETVYKLYRSTCMPELEDCSASYEVIDQFQVSPSLDSANSFVDRDIANAEKYYYVVSAEAGSWELNSSTISVTTHPAAVTNFIVSSVGSQSIQLFWDNPGDNQGDANHRMYVYTCEPDSSECLPSLREFGTGDISSYTVEGLSVGTSYYFKLGLYTDVIEVNSSVVGSYTIVAQPYAISYESSIDSAVISWSSDNGPDTLYTLEAYVCDSSFSCVWDDSLLEPTYSTSAVYDGLYSGSAYEIRINARAGERSSTSNEEVIYTSPIAADVNNNQFEVSEIGQNSITLKWDTSINGSSSSYIPIRYFCDLSIGEECSGLQLGTFNSLSESVIDTGLSEGSVYSYKLRSVNETSIADSAALVVTTAPPTQENISAVAGDANVSLSWQIPDDSPYEYDAYQSELNCQADQVLSNNTVACGAITIIEQTTTGVVFADLLPATSYYYWVLTRNNDNNTHSISEQVTANAWPRAPNDVNWSSDVDSITINWDVNDNGALVTWKIYRYSCDPAADSCFAEPHTENLDYANAAYQDTHELDQGQEYFYVVSAIAGNQEFFSPSAAAILTPYPASSLHITAGASSNEDYYTAAQAGLYVELNWSAADNALGTNYTIHRRECSLSGDCFSHQFGSYSGQESYSITHAYDEMDSTGSIRELTPAQEYYYTISSAVTSSGGDLEVNYSSAIITHPVLIQELSAYSVSSNVIDVSWSVGNNGSEIGYGVSAYYCTDDDATSCSLYGSYLNLDEVNLSVTELFPASHYAFEITALSGDGGVTSALLTGTATHPVALENVEISTYEQQDQAVIEVDWTSNNGPAASYKRYLYECISISTCNLLAAEVGELDSDYSLSSGVYTWIDDELNLGSLYKVIMGIDSGGVELTSDVLEVVTAPSAPVNLEATVAVSGEVELRWDDSNNNLISNISYIAYAFRNTCSAEELIADLDNNNDDRCAIVAQGETNAKSYLFSGLATGNTYFFAVKVSNVSGSRWVADTEQIALTLQPQAPSDLNVSDINNVGFRVSFGSASNGADTGYRVYLAECDNPDSCGKYSVTDLADGELELTYSNLIPGQHYSIIASAIATDLASNIMETNSSSLNAITHPEAVINLIAIGQETNSIEINFTSNNGSATTYSADRYNCGSDPNNCFTTNVEASAELLFATSYTDDSDDLHPATYYAYTVIASTNENGEEASASTTTPALTAPTALGIDSVTPGLTNLSASYSTPSGALDYYYIVLSEFKCDSAAVAANDADECGTIVLSDTNATAPVVFAGLAVGSTYYLRSVVGNATASVYSDAESSKTLSAYTSLEEPLAKQQWHLVNDGTNTAFASDAGTSGIDINYTGALDMELTGRGVRINVIDTGLEMQHPDLEVNIVAGGSYDFVDNDTNPTNNTDNDGDHGTAIAGIIGAATNGIGGVGVAPSAGLQGFNFLKEQNSANFVAATGGDSRLRDTAIFNKSFGNALQYDHLYQSSYLDALSCFASGGAFDLAFGSSCAGALRSGLGAIYVKSAGNEFAEGDTDDWCRNAEINLTCYNANMDNSRNYPYQIVVGSVNAHGTKASYSSAGSSLWLTAPGGEYGWNYDYISEELGDPATFDKSSLPDEQWQPAIITTDQVGCERGYSSIEHQLYDDDPSVVVKVNPLHDDEDLNSGCDYTATFSGASATHGASAAAPVVSGVIALMLEANPNLSWRDVKHILASTARPVDVDIPKHSVPYMVCLSDCSDGLYIASNNRSFDARDAWIKNAAGYSFHSWYGFGLVNAGAAAAMAENYTSELGDWDMFSVSVNSIGATIPDATDSAASTTINVTDDLAIEAAQIDLQVTHHDLSSLAVVLTSPRGTRSVLLTPFNKYKDANFASTLLSNAFYGESAEGDWNLEIYDLVEDAAIFADGTLNSVTLNIYGHNK